MHWAKEGAFTGEVFRGMLNAIQVTHVIIGHSERRQYFNETDDTVNRKLEIALENWPDAHRLRRRSTGGARGRPDRRRAAPPVHPRLQWHLGKESGQTRHRLRTRVGHRHRKDRDAADGLGCAHGDPPRGGERHSAKNLPSGLRILYGGSVKPDNATALMSETEIDGALVGGASLDPASFTKIVKY